MLLRESTKVIYDRALERLDKVLHKAKQHKLLEQGVRESHLRFTGYSLGIFDQLLRITTEKFLLIPDYSLKVDHNRNIINPELLRKKSPPNTKCSFSNRLRNTTFTAEDFIHDQGPFEWLKLSTAALDEACAIFNQIDNIQPAATTSFYKFMPVETETTGQVSSRVLLMHMNVFELGKEGHPPELALQTFGYSRVVDWRHFLNEIDFIRYSDQPYSLRLGTHRIGRQGIVRAGRPPLSPVLEKLFYFEKDRAGVLVAVCDVSRGKRVLTAILCTLLQNFRDEDWSLNPAHGSFEFGPHCAPLKALIHYFREKERSIALRLRLLFECIGIPVVVERKHLPPHEAIIQDARRGFPFIVSVRAESSETGIVGFFCTYTKITEMCDVRNVINQVHMYVSTDV